MGLKIHTGFSKQCLRAVQAYQPSQSQVRDLGPGADRPSELGLEMEHTAKRDGILPVSAVPELPICSCLFLPLVDSLTNSLKPRG